MSETRRGTTVLARKWRPRSFATLVGQDHVVRALSHALVTRRLHHAYLLTGTRGVGKTTIARILAKALNCEEAGLGHAPMGEPCGRCAACTGIDAGRFPDYVELDAASNRGVDEMTQLLDAAVYAPSAGRYKVYVIDEVHMLSKHAFNAMLKTLEEPPGHVVFILATTDPQQVPVTVLSRCLQFGLRNMTPQAVAGHLAHVLREEGIAADPEALDAIGRAAAGSMRDALSLLDQAIAHGGGRVAAQDVRDMLGSVDRDFLLRILQALATGDSAGALAVADEMAALGLSFAQALQELATLLHRLALARAGVADALAVLPALEPLVHAFDAAELQVHWQVVIHGGRDLPLAPDEHAGFTMTLLRLFAFRPDVDGAEPVVRAPTAVPARGDAGPAALRAAVAAPARVAGVSPRERMQSAMSPLAAADPVPVLPATVTPDRSVVADPPDAPTAPILPESGSVAAPRSAVPATPTRPNVAEGGRSAALAMARVMARGAGAAQPAPAAPAAPEARRSRPEAGASQVLVRPAPEAVRPALPPAVPEAEQGDPEDPGPFADDPGPFGDAVPVASMPTQEADVHAGGDAADEAPPRADEARAAQAAADLVARVSQSAADESLPFEGDWPAFAATLALNGMARQFALQSECLGHHAGTLRLRVPLRALADPALVARVRDAVCARLEHPLRLDVTVGATSARTAAAAFAARDAEAIARATAALDDDEFVRALKARFGAGIVPGSIRPLQANDAGDAPPQEPRS